MQKKEPSTAHIGEMCTRSPKLLFDQETEEKVTEDLAQQADQLNLDQYINLGNLTIEDPLLAALTMEEFIKVIRCIKNKTPGISQIRKLVITNIPPIIIHRLNDIFNASLASGYFPQRFKSALLTLIPKAGKPPNRLENFRLISFLEILGKILERILSTRLRSYLEENQLLNVRQYGFMQSRGTSTAIDIAYEDPLPLSQ